jgi:(p)ppGpp synthase/HD superfamily hydrolase
LLHLLTNIGKNITYNINNGMRFNNYLNEINTLNEIKQLLIEMSLEDAIEFATQMHQGQIRKGDKKPYVVHPQAVYSILKSFNVKDRVILVAAWLHDTIEDTKATYNIIKRKFNKEVANLVKALSSDPKEIAKIGKEEYLLKKMLQMSNNELTVKLADRLHNVTDIMSNPKAENLYNQTVYIINGLRENRTLTKIHKKLIKAIERYLNKYKELP